MSEQDTTENVDSSNDGVQDTEEIQDEAADQSVADTEEGSESIDELKEKLAEKDRQNIKLFKRAKKAEGFEEQPDGTWVKVQRKAKAVAATETEAVNNNDGFSASDLYALINAKVPQDDLDEVKDYAKLKGITITEALKAPMVKTILSTKAEERRTADATNTGSVRRGTGKVSGDALLRKAMTTGELPERDEDMEEIVEARYKK